MMHQGLEQYPKLLTEKWYSQLLRIVFGLQFHNFLYLYYFGTSTTEKYNEKNKQFSI